MSWLLFLDESGHDHRMMPYEVHGGIAIHAEKLWPFIDAVMDAEQAMFGAYLHEFGSELKGEKLLKKKRFQWHAQGAAMEHFAHMLTPLIWKGAGRPGGKNNQAAERDLHCGAVSDEVKRKEGKSSRSNRSNSSAEPPDMIVQPKAGIVKPLMKQQFTESVVEEAALAWLEAAGWAVVHGPEIAPESSGAEWEVWVTE